MKTALPDEIRAGEHAGDVPGGSARPLLSLVIPVRDVAASLPATLVSVKDWIAQSHMAVEVVVVDDGSSDGTRATAAAFGRRIERLQILRHLETRGYFEAIRTAEPTCAGTLIAFGREEELSSSLEVCGDLLMAIMEGADLAFLASATERWTPGPPPGDRGLADSCRDWIRRALNRPREPRAPAFVMSRTTALRNLLCESPTDGEAETDWLALARRAKCRVNVLGRGTPSSHPRPEPAPKA